MSRDEIIKMAREACDPDTVDAWKNGYWILTQEELERFAAIVVQAERNASAKEFKRLAIHVAAAEREACARMVTDCAWNLKGPAAAVEVEACAAAIRARGEK